MEINDNQLLELVDKVDNLILDILETTGIPAFFVTSIILARLAAMARDSGVSEDFKRLLEHSIETIDEDALASSLPLQ